MVQGCQTEAKLNPCDGIIDWKHAHQPCVHQFVDGVALVSLEDGDGNVPVGEQVLQECLSGFVHGADPLQV